ncbi:class I SAM-dependent methyltransferase [Patescibacteria group bacterium]
MKDPRLFLRTFLKDPRVAAVRPSSPRLVARLLKFLPIAGIKRIVEFGPGDGAVTHPLLACLAEDAQYVAIEQNLDFIEQLKRIDDPRFSLVQGSVTDDVWHTCTHDVDAVIASIPFSMFTREDRRKVLDAAHRILRPGGVCIVFHQYTPVMRKYMRERFGEVHSEFEPLNLLPCFLFVARKN